MVAKTKTCNTCKRELPLEDFHKSKREADGRQWKCRLCTSQNHKAYLQKAREARKQYLKDWRKRNPDDWRTYSQTQQAKARKKLSHEVEKGNIERPEICVRCGGEGRPVSDGRSPIQAHHHDYSKPLKVEWLCGDCHGAEHALYSLVAS